MAGRRRPPTDKEVELEIARISSKFDLWKRFVPVLYIAALWFPVSAAQPIIDDVAGQDTNITVAFGVNISISIILGGTAFAVILNNRALRRENERMRERMTWLEEELDKRRGISQGGDG